MSSDMTTLGKVAAKVETMSLNNWDTLVPVKSLRFDSLDTIRIDGEAHVLREQAQRSIAARLGVPVPYLRRCPTDLQAHNLNHWIEKEHQERDDLFFRFDGTEVRAIFTTRYRPVDNTEVVERLYSLGYKDSTRVRCQMDAEFFSVSIPDGAKTFVVGEKDRITPGIAFGNSEVGVAALSVSAFFLRLVCTNGMIAQTEVSSSFRHVSVNILDEFPSVMGKIAGELSQQRHGFQISLETEVKNPLATISSFNRQFLLAKVEQEAAEWGYGFEPGNSMFHVVNAYTKGAQRDGLKAEERNRLERVGGSVLRMVQ